MASKSIPVINYRDFLNKVRDVFLKESCNVKTEDSEHDYCSSVKVFLNLFSEQPLAAEVEGHLEAMVKTAVR